jgi:spore coat polysaccharide biosynthesis protein SpsF
MKLTNSRNVLEVLIDRIKKSNYVKKILIATTQNKIDDKIVRIAKKNKCLFFRGSENNVLSRLVLGTKKHKENSIIQLTGDNPLIDAKIIDYMASFFISKYPRYDFVTNNNLFNNIPILTFPRFPLILTGLNPCLSCPPHPEDRNIYSP